jgi:DNA-directed RNA polymerase
LTVTIKDKYDNKKQVRALMPNLIHSLDGTSLILLYEQFVTSLSKESGSVQFFSVHDCFGTTCEKVSLMKTILASIYTDLYSADPYLDRFDKSIIDSIESATVHRVNRETRKVINEYGEEWFTLHDIN